MDENLPVEELLRYIDGEMNEAERRAVETRLAADASLRQQVESLKLATEAVKQAGVAQQVRDIHQEQLALRKPAGHGKVRLMRLWVRLAVSVAAVVALLLVSAIVWVAQVNHGEVYTAHYTPYRLTAQRGEAGTSSLQKEYQLRNYQSVVTQGKTSRLRAEDSLLVALSYLQLNQSAAAQTWLQALQTTRGEFKEDADYYLAFAFLQSREYAKALLLFNAIRQNARHLYQAQVSPGLLWKIRALQWK